MKTSTIRFTAIAVLLLVSSFSFANLTGNKTNEFEITPVENLFLGKSIEKIWTVSYSEQEKPITITRHSVGNSKEYVVRSEFFEVIYISDNEGFGVKKIYPSLKEVPARITSSVLNKQQMQTQRILTPNKVSDEYALSLIASYLPDLLNDGYKHLIY